MKLAAAYALAELAKLPVPEEVNIAYNARNLKFGKDYIIPKPVDPRLILHVAPAVAKAAMDTGIARKPIENWDAYQEELGKRLGLVNPLIQQIKGKARRNPKRVIFAEAENDKVLKAAEIVVEEGIAHPILLGDKNTITQMIKGMTWSFRVWKSLILNRTSRQKRGAFRQTSTMKKGNAGGVNQSFHWTS